MSLYPLLKDEAGSHAWSTMHHRASLYPDNPTDKEKERMKDFIYESMQSVALLCKNCKNHIRDYLKKNPLKPALESRDKLSQYLCTMHNSVNETQGKQTHDCTKILRPKEEAECKDSSCSHSTTKNIVQKDTTLDLRNTFEKFKEISTKVFHALCDKYKLPYPTIKFHECPSNPLNSCTSMWIDSQTQDIAERPVVYLHPNLFGLRSIVHEFMHYMKQLKKDTLGGLNEEEVERETQAIINHEFPFDEIDNKDTRAPVIAQTHLVRNDYVSRLREFPIASRIYDKHLVNIKRRDFRRGTNEEQSESGDWVFDMLNKNNNIIDNEQQQEQQGQGQQHIFSFMDGVYSPFASLFGMKASDLNKTNTPMLVSNAALAIIKSQMSPIGALLLSTATSLGIYGAMAFSRHSLSYGDKFLMNVFGSNFLFNSIDYVRPELKQDIVEGAMTLGNVVAAQQWDLIPHILLGDSLSSFLGETSTSTASPLSAARNLQRAAIGNRGASSGSLAGGRGNSNSNTIRSAAIDPKQQLADLRAIQRETAGTVTGPDNPLAVRAVKTGAGRGGNPADVIRARAQSQQSVGGSGVNSMPMYDPNSVMIPSDDTEVYESAFGMHVADGTGGASTRDDIDIGDRRNTVRDIFNTDPNYDNFNDVYYYSDEEVDMGYY